ncbi:glycosyltransferase family 2 protein [Microbacterium sp. zg.B48]|uniref:glycosyltransferase family 2 protein n=1 Tax=Microbacterium sp. zg.B48 TaxID=2969408 RepID=UPI00214A91EF|nr:glycosyltransferase family 2 protein [Microbacterium sp. zg.B48]MCR2764186.1 glycosyltransferase family 2 protein [Microbacterium sp. zg.B48]
MSGARVTAAPVAAPTAVRPTFVIAAHNEERVIGACLSALLRQDVHGDQIIVVANGCRDRTAEVAGSYGVTVIDRPTPGKAGALNAGDAVASSYPRVYLDADIVPPQDAITTLVTALERTPRALAVVPRRRMNTAGRPWPVRAYFSINERLPAFRDGLFGRGLIVVSEAGRSRFGAFPALVADDLFLDSQFDRTEKAEVSEVSVVVEAPYKTRDLMNRLVRVRRGNAEMRAAAATGQIPLEVRPTDRWAWLRVALPQPRLWPGALAYFSITMLAARRARRTQSAGAGWGQDTSTRRRAPVPADGMSP